jgi:penicillin-binding protein 2
LKSRVRSGQIIVENRYRFLAIIILCFTSLLSVRLWFVQVYRGPYYRQASQRNRIRQIEVPAPRGMIVDRLGKTILGNRPFFDLAFIPQYVKDKDETLKILSRILHIPIRSLERRIRIAGGGPRYLPIVLKKNLNLDEVSTIEANKMFLPGVDVIVAPRRDYGEVYAPHMIGYLSEIDDVTLKRINKTNPEARYFPGDLIGKQGLEKRYEKFLRGKRGYRFIQVDALGRQTQQQDLVDWELPVQPAIPGNDVELSIDRELQIVVSEAFRGKYGAIVVLNPQTFEILSMISSPGFDPNLYQEGISRGEWKALVSNPFNPLYDKTSGGEYPPGSIYKAVVAIAALQEGVVTTETKVTCPGYYTLGDQTFHCWERRGHGIVNLRKALYRSCDVYFYETGVQLGVDKIAEYALKLGLGRLPGLRLNTEKAGLIPNSAWKQLTQRVPWTKGDTPNVSIGQGYNLVTPLQIASLYATIGNGGVVRRPYVVQRITDNVGREVFREKGSELWKITDIDPQVLNTVKDMLRDVVEHPDGTGKNSKVNGVSVAGKTGSVQVVSLKRNRNFEDVSMKWREHALFAAFAPVDNPEIALAIVSENDAVGGGGASAAPVAGKIIKAFFRLKKERLQANKIARGPQVPPKSE